MTCQGLLERTRAHDAEASSPGRKADAACRVRDSVAREPASPDGLQRQGVRDFFATFFFFTPPFPFVIFLLVLKYVLIPQMEDARKHFPHQL